MLIRPRSLWDLKTGTLKPFYRYIKPSSACRLLASNYSTSWTISEHDNESIWVAFMCIICMRWQNFLAYTGCMWCHSTVTPPWSGKHATVVHWHGKQNMQNNVKMLKSWWQILSSSTAAMSLQQFSVTHTNWIKVTAGRHAYMGMYFTYSALTGL